METATFQINIDLFLNETSLNQRHIIHVLYVSDSIDNINKICRESTQQTGGLR